MAAEALSDERLAQVSRALARLERLSALGPDERSALIAQMGDSRLYERKACIERQAEPARAVSILVSGLACAVRMLDDGRQMNVAIYVPGDFMNLTAHFAGISRASLFALTPVKVLQIASASISGLFAQYPGLERALLRNMIMDGAIAQEWMIGMGRRSALQRLAHFLCEVFVRLQRVGLASADECEFPLTQDTLADTLGLSVVHTNRMLQQLRGESLITLQHGRLVILDWQGLARSGGFDPDYLDFPSVAAPRN